MKYTIGTDDYFPALHLMAIAECLDHRLSYATMPALGSLTTLVDLAGDEFQRIAEDGAIMDGEPVFESKESPMYGALLDLQVTLRRTEVRLSRLIDSAVKAK